MALITVFADKTVRVGIGFKVLNMVCCWIEAPDSEAFKCHLSRIKDYLWVAEDGMKMQVHSQSSFFLFLSILSI